MILVLSDEEHKAYQKKYRTSLGYKTSQKKYNSKPERKASQKKHKQKPENKAKAKKWSRSPERRAFHKLNRESNRLKILKYYSKQLSKSNIPCCNCCGENFDISFLAIDHIAGKKQMDSEPKLLKLGYSSSLDGDFLLAWIIKNNFPEVFQILCHNCNYAKGIVRNKNKCPHQK